MKKILNTAYKQHIQRYRTTMNDRLMKPIVQQVGQQIRAAVRENEINKNLKKKEKEKNSKNKTTTSSVTSTSSSSGPSTSRSTARFSKLSRNKKVLPLPGHDVVCETTDDDDDDDEDFPLTGEQVDLEESYEEGMNEIELVNDDDSMQEQIKQQQQQQEVEVPEDNYAYDEFQYESEIN